MKHYLLRLIPPRPRISPLIFLVAFMGAGVYPVWSQTSESGDDTGGGATEERYLKNDQIPKASFTQDRYRVKDPFFPLSERYRPKQPVVSTSQPKVVKPPPDPLRHLKLRGIIGSSRRRVALINNRTAMQGEMIEVETPDGAALIRVISIRGTSVLIKINQDPQPKQLVLPSAM